MKAAVRSKYGLPRDLTVKEVDTPTPKENEVLVRVTEAYMASGQKIGNVVVTMD